MSWSYLRTSSFLPQIQPEAEKIKNMYQADPTILAGNMGHMRRVRVRYFIRSGSMALAFHVVTQGYSRVNILLLWCRNLIC